MTPWCVIVPVKRLDRAKTRLHTNLADGTPANRADLALAFASDVVTAALAAQRVAHVVVVTDDPLASATLGALGALIVPDSPDSGINPALVHGCEAALSRWPGTSIAALSSDVPCALPDDIDAVLGLADVSNNSRSFLSDASGVGTSFLSDASGVGTSFLSDASGVGTTMFMAPAGTPFTPAFGRRSRAAHRAAGAHEIVGTNLQRLRRDVDTEADLWDARRLGTGAHTAALLPPT